MGIMVHSITTESPRFAQHSVTLNSVLHLVTMKWSNCLNKELAHLQSGSSALPTLVISLFVQVLHSLTDGPANALCDVLLNLFLSHHLPTTVSIFWFSLLKCFLRLLYNYIIFPFHCLPTNPSMYLTLPLSN